MRKRVLFLSLLAVVGLFLVACNKTTELTSITISGADNVTLDFQATFNVLDGVTALGNDGVDYTDQITYVSTSDITDDLLDTTATGNHAIQYNVSVGEVLAQTWRYITVSEPQAEEGQMLVNPDFATGTTGWDSDSVVYQADGGTIALTNEDGALKAEVVAGSNPYTPRFGQMNVPFENGVTYLISFDAKSSAEKIINLQVGELLSADPYFTDFKPGVVIHKTITTDWATYSYKFTMNQPETNHRGGLLFELGTVESQTVDATMWFDNIKVEVSTPDADETAPAFAGVNATKQIYVDSVYDPMAGVSAFDALDGDVTADITYVITDENDAVVDTLSTSAAGNYTITYSVTDAAGNTQTAVTLLSIVEAPLDTYALPEWRAFANTWEGSDVSLYGMNGQMVLMINNANFYESWQLQIIQDQFALGGLVDNEGSMQLVAGQTYKVTFDAKSSVAGDFAVQIGSSLPSWVAYHSETLSVTNEMQTFSFDFTLDAAGDYTSKAQFKLELGGLFGSAVAGDSFKLDNVKIEELDTDGVTFIDANLIVAGDMEKVVYQLEEWRAFSNTWEGSTTTLAGINGQMVLTVTGSNFSQGWHLQIIQDAFALGTGEDNVGSMQLVAGQTYKVTFDAKSSIEGDFALQIGSSIPSWVAYHSETLSVTQQMQTFTVEFTLDAAGDFTSPAQFKLELGTLFTGAPVGATFTLDNVVIQELDTDGVTYIDAGLIENGAMDVELYQAEAWRAFSNSWEGSNVTLTGMNGQLVLNILSGNFYEGWHLQLIQDQFAIDGITDNEGSIQFVAGETYRVTFDAKASIAGDFALQIGSSIPSWVAYHSETLSVTTDMQTFTVDFTLDAAGDFTSPAQFKLELGNLFAGAQTGQFVLDNVLIQKLDTDGVTYVDADFIVNGTMDPTPVV